MRLDRASWSQLSTHADCEMAWWLEKVVRAPGRTAAWFHHGTAVHSAIEEWERAGRISDDGAVEIFVNEYDQLISQHKQSHPDLSLWLRGRGSTEKDIETRRTKGVDQVEWRSEERRVGTGSRSQGALG